MNVNLLGFVPGAVGQVAFGKYVFAGLRDRGEVHPAGRDPDRDAGGPGRQRGVLQPVPAFGAQARGRVAGGDLRPRCRGQQARRRRSIGGGASLALAASLAEQGIATIAINVVGHGFGPLSTLTVTPSVGGTGNIPRRRARHRPERRRQSSRITKGSALPPPRSIIRDRDGQRQTVADLMQLVRVIEVGMDVDGDGVADLDPSRIYYLGQSLGGIYGTDVPGRRAERSGGRAQCRGGIGQASLNRLSPVFRAAVGTSLAARTPSLLNGPGVTSLDGVSVLGQRFDENLPLRDGVPLVVRLADGTERVIQSPVINTVPGAMPIQEVIEHTEWVSQSGDPVAYAPHIRKTPLAGVPAKSVIYQFAKGDQIVPNPATTALLRAGDLADRATFYRHDLAFAENPQLPTNPHGFLATLDIPGFRAITRGAQEQIATFFATDGTAVIHPEPARFFEMPISLPLPEGLNYIP